MSAAAFSASAALLAAFLSGVTLFLTGQRETRKWVRESLLDAEVQFLGASFAYPARRLFEYLERGGTLDSTQGRKYEEAYQKSHMTQNDALTRIRLLAKEDVVTAAEELHKNDEITSRWLLSAKHARPTDIEFNELYEAKKKAREVFISRSRTRFLLSPGAPITNYDVDPPDSALIDATSDGAPE